MKVESQRGQFDLLLRQPPQETLTRFPTEIKRIIHKVTEPIDEFGNTLSRYRVVMSEGTPLGLNICQPKERVTDIPVLESPAWFTGLHGFNEGTQRMLGGLGFPSLLLGYPGGERDSWFKELTKFIRNPLITLTELKNLSIAQHAHNMRSLMNRVNDYLPIADQIDDSQALANGFSRGAMTLLGLPEEVGSETINIPFALDVAACFKEGLGRNNIMRAGLQVPYEVANVAILGARNLANWGLMSPNTVNLSPKSIVYELAYTPTLLRGDGGLLAKCVPLSQNMVILGYGNDVAGQLSEWEMAFINHPNVIVRPAPGAHGSLILDKRTREYVIQVWAGIAEQLKNGVNPDKFNIVHCLPKAS